jgi:hypothetical protein
MVRHRAPIEMLAHMRRRRKAAHRRVALGEDTANGQRNAALRPGS